MVGFIWRIGDGDGALLGGSGWVVSVAIEKSFESGEMRCESCSCSDDMQ